MATPDLLLGTAARTPLVRGFNQLADLLAITLGPLQGAIVAARDLGAPFDRLTDSATLARRLVRLPDRAESAGAMILRNLVWRLHQSVGDGCATAAVLAQALVREGERYRAAGVDALALRQGIERGAAAAITALHAQTQPVPSIAALRHVAQSLTADPQLARLLAEIFDLLGSSAHIEVEEYVAPYLEREYHAGGRWQVRLASPQLISDAVQQRATLNDAVVAITPDPLTTLADVRPLLELVAQQPRPRLLLVAPAISGAALATLLLNHQREQLRCVAVELRRTGDDLRDDCADLAALTGARVLHRLSGGFSAVTLADLGQTARCDAHATALYVRGAHADRVERIAALHAHLATLPSSEPAQAAALQERIARLAGATVTLKIGAIHRVEREALRQEAERAIRALRLALRSGVVAGGGVAYLNCIAAVQATPCAGDAVYGRTAVATALAAPFCRIVANAGRRDPAAALAEVRAHGSGWGYDVATNTMCDMCASGITDPTAVLAAALQSAASGAAIMLTTDALVLKRNPTLSFEP